MDSSVPSPGIEINKAWMTIFRSDQHIFHMVLTQNKLDWQLLIKRSKHVVIKQIKYLTNIMSTNCLFNTLIMIQGIC